MLKHLLTPLLAAFALAAAAATADEAAALIARDKAASGGARWDAVKTLETSGTLHAGGLDVTAQELRHGAHGLALRHLRMGGLADPRGAGRRAPRFAVFSAAACRTSRR